ncbi:PREDICTED: uncharacterized protein C7orf50 homolog [Priapulus caudatus]|uniref:Uncharacterized protein C7orf50 homolog n=1 Tax=Priapulus caudatus TaxID=37621 RepID=A0ABM1DTB9_PRICU|nr:PREDICTED: uncharacterized protein C7orf50 homolog [Priapulus caudatus]XP_014663191.1 PREDICTED: uncharacterized protein C7orf50 homolog [Priapulus caudatus]
MEEESVSPKEAKRSQKRKHREGENSPTSGKRQLCEQSTNVSNTGDGGETTEERHRHAKKSKKGNSVVEGTVTGDKLIKQSKKHKKEHSTLVSLEVASGDTIPEKSEAASSKGKHHSKKDRHKREVQEGGTAGDSVGATLPQKDSNKKHLKKAIKKNSSLSKDAKLNTPSDKISSVNGNKEKTAQEEEELEKEKIREKKRQKRKLKKQLKAEEKEKEKAKEGQGEPLAIEYLKSFTSDKAKWKFCKVRQIWLLQHMYDVDKLSGSDFALLLEYLEDLKGQARSRTAEEAETMLRSLDQEPETTGENEAVGVKKEESKWTDEQLDRARQIVQLLS